MRIGDTTQTRGYVTKLKFIAGRDLRYLERVLGFHPGRFSNGVWIMKLDRIPLISEFEARGYSMIAEHRFVDPTNLNMNRVKQNALDSWTLTGPDSLVKIRPEMAHDAAMEPDIQYPPGLGAPQWKLVAPVPASVIAYVSSYPTGVFRAA
jgi:hypothetical protein